MPRLQAQAVALFLLVVFAVVQTPGKANAQGGGCAQNPEGCLHNPMSSGCMQNCACKVQVLNGDPVGLHPHNLNPHHRRFDNYWIPWDLNASSFVSNDAWAQSRPSPDFHPAHIIAQDAWNQSTSNLHLYERGSASHADIATGMWTWCKWQRTGLSDDSFGITYWSYRAPGSVEQAQTGCPSGFPCNWTCYFAVRIRFNGYIRWEDHMNCGIEEYMRQSGEPVSPTSCSLNTDSGEQTVLPPLATYRAANARIVAHEFGHALGLHGDLRFPSNSCGPTSLMQYTGVCGFNTGCLTSVSATSLDVLAMRFLYGP